MEGMTQTTAPSRVPGPDAPFAIVTPDPEADAARRRGLRIMRSVALGLLVVAAVVYVATEMAGPGHLRHHGRGELLIEPFPHSAQMAKALAEAGVPTEVSDNVRGALWAKLILNCAYNALSALARLPYGELVQRPGVADVMRDAVAECKAVAQAEGVTLPLDVDTTVRRIPETMPTQFSSTPQDLMRGKPTEIDHLNGHVVRRGEALGVPTPANRVLWTMVKLAEAPRQA